MSAVHKHVKEYYGQVLGSTKDLKTSACTSAQRPSAPIRALLEQIPRPVLDKFYGCGTPLPSAGLEGLSVLDLGCGSGRDCYLASALVGNTGKVVGIDMTQEQLDVANQHAGKYCQEVLHYSQSNMTFLLGYIEALEGLVPAESMDLIISNCVINLSPDKPSVLRGMYHALKFGGEAYFSDVYCDRRLSDEARAHQVLWGECISGALYQQDFLRLAGEVGFLDCRMLDRTEIIVTTPSFCW
ncbi:hypothetical protein BASA81_011323 [Batrachochytrium salamandrivorans]|nr:hypothetical protein BASA81_011323 [Batrachochytrium salamandrivorans]